jgi:hypothetical protein
MNFLFVFFFKRTFLMKLCSHTECKIEHNFVYKFPHSCGGLQVTSEGGGCPQGVAGGLKGSLVASMGWWWPQ